MPPENSTPPDHLLAQEKKSAAGPIIGTIIIIALLVLGALYFWGQHLNRENSEDTLPFIPPDPTAGGSTTAVQ